MEKKAKEEVLFPLEFFFKIEGLHKLRPEESKSKIKQIQACWKAETNVRGKCINYI